MALHFWAKNVTTRWSAVAEWSKAFVIFCLGSWKRKVVGSNPDDDLYRTFVFFCGVENGVKNRMKEFDWNLRFSRNFRGTRGRSNQPSSRGMPSTNIVEY